MIAKRIGAALLAVGLIVGAVAIRQGVIEGDSTDSSSTGDDDEPELADVLYCASELAATCRAIADDYDELDVRITTAGTTRDQLATSDPSQAMWLTFQPYPAMVDTLRTASGKPPLEYDTIAVASSPLAVVVRNDRRADLVAACGDPVDLACLADQPSLSPTFAPVSTAVGALGVTAAASSYGDGAFDLNDVQFIVWGRRLAQSGASSLSGGTAVQTIQTRPTFAVAIGAEAELSPTQRDSFTVLQPIPATTMQVVLVVPDGVAVDDEFVTSLEMELAVNSWEPALSDPVGQLDPGVILAVSDIWEDLQ